MFFNDFPKFKVEQKKDLTRKLKQKLCMSVCEDANQDIRCCGVVLGALLGALGVLLGRSWALLGRSWGDLERFWRPLGAILGALGTLWGAIGGSWGALGALLG